MEMEFKTDWPEAAERFEAWWAGDVTDRAALQVTAPRDGYRSTATALTMEQRWTDTASVVESAEERMRSTFYGGEAFPLFFPNLGPDVFSAYLGCDLVFDPRTSWAEPNILDWDSPPKNVFRFYQPLVEADD